MIEEKKYIEFKESFEKAISRNLENQLPNKEILIESKIELKSITPKFYRILKQFEPFGPGNKTPIFLTKELYLDGILSKVGKEKEHIKFSVVQNKKHSFPSIGFWMSDKSNKILSQNSFSMAYSIDQNNWNGKKSIQLKIRDIK
jgi:single-stranded-DNA-specific exonuclease